MPIRAIKDRFEFEIDDEYLESYLAFRRFNIDKTNQLYVFPTNYNVVSVGKEFSLLETFFGIFINYLDEGFFIPLDKIVYVLNNTLREFIVVFGIIRRLGFALMFGMTYAMCIIKELGLIG